MNNSNCWKQPIPTNIDELCLGDEFAATIFMRLLLRARQSDGCVYVEGVPILLKRGQCICGRFELAACFGIPRRCSKRVSRKLTFLEKTTKLLTKRKSLNCSIVTILNFDELTSMTNQMTNRRPIDDQSMTTNKSVKNVESVKKENLKIPNTASQTNGAIKSFPTKAELEKLRDKAVKGNTFSRLVQKVEEEGWLDHIKRIYPHLYRSIQTHKL